MASLIQRYLNTLDTHADAIDAAYKSGSFDVSSLDAAEISSLTRLGVIDYTGEAYKLSASTVDTVEMAYAAAASDD